MEKIVLEVLQDALLDGYQDDEGVIHYDDRVRTKFGNLGNLRIEKVSEKWVIKDTPGVVLFGKSLIQSLLSGYEDECTEMSRSPLGLNTVLVKGGNGTARYQLHNAPLEWSDRPGEEVKGYLATLTYQEWEPV